MKIVIIGGTGLIGSKTVAILRQGGHEVVAASPQSGINTITGEGLKAAMAGTQVVIDLANSPSFEDKAVLEFFETSGRNLLAAEAAAGVRHHVALSIVGTDRTPDNGYFRAKVAQEKLIEASGIPYTIIRATQFLEFLGGIAAESTDGNMVRLPPGLFQPIAADDVAAIVADVALAAPRNGIVEIAGPERAPFNEIVARYLKAVGDPREVVSDPEARYFGGRLEEHSLVPLGEARRRRIGLDEWLRRSQTRDHLPEPLRCARTNETARKVAKQLRAEGADVDRPDHRRRRYRPGTRCARDRRHCWRPHPHLRAPADHRQRHAGRAGWLLWRGARRAGDPYGRGREESRSNRRSGCGMQDRVRRWARAALGNSYRCAVRCRIRRRAP